MNLSSAGYIRPYGVTDGRRARAETKMSVCLNVLRRDLKSGMLPRLISLTMRTIGVMHDINTEPGFYSHVN